MDDFEAGELSRRFSTVRRLTQVEVAMSKKSSPKGSKSSRKSNKALGESDESSDDGAYIEDEEAGSASDVRNYVFVSVELYASTHRATICKYARTTTCKYIPTYMSTHISYVHTYVHTCVQTHRPAMHAYIACTH